MLSNYFTFYHTAQLLNERYAGTVIAEAYSQEKNTLSIVVYTPEPHTITISCVGRKNAIVARAGNPRTKHNSVDLFPDIINDHIHSVFMDRSDRIVHLRLLSGIVLCIEMFGARANVLLCETDGTIVDAFLDKKTLAGAVREIQSGPQAIAAEEYLPPRETFIASFNENDKNAFQVLKSLVPKLGSTLAHEVLLRAEIPESASGLSGADKDRLLSETTAIFRSLIVPTDSLEPSVYFEENSPVAVSLLPLRYYESLQRETYPDLFVALQKFLSYEKSEQSYLQKKKEIIHWLTNESNRTERTIAAVEKEHADSSRADQYEKFGKLLMGQLHLLAKGMASVDIDDHISGSGTLTIPLDPLLTPVKNAERYFDKAKRSRSAYEESEERLISLRSRSGSLSALRDELTHVSDSISLKNFLRLQSSELKRLGFMTKKEEEELPPFKTFVVEGGFTVYAGKSSENNDLLTVKWAKPNDLWFHARGSSGSHVVLKIGSGSGNPSKKAIEQAAAIAAWYSKMKNAKNVPVAMTEKKYVRKPKGVPAGTVVIEKEKVIFVQPRLPHNEA
ncbi:MAG: NFACT RNA binding domain-containing protein [Bacteroidota bacterium]